MILDMIAAAAAKLPPGPPLLPGASGAPVTPAGAQPSVPIGPAPAIVPTTPLAHSMPWLTHAFAGFFVISALLLIVLLAVQTTKQEGLSGTIGGRSESIYRGRLGPDKQLARITNAVAYTFVFFALLVSITGI
jgi:protein translocase SecG subunit